MVELDEDFRSLSNQYKSVFDLQNKEIEKKTKCIGFLVFTMLIGFLGWYFEHKSYNYEVEEFHNYREDIHTILEENQQFEADNLIKQYEQEIWEGKQDMWINAH